MASLLIIDGAQGEGGGQILRTSLALAAVTGQAVRVENIRAGRHKPGLAPQHLVVCRAIAAVCGGELRHDRLRSLEIELYPQTLRGGDFIFDVAAESPSAGATTLICQALLPILLLTPIASEVTLQGGTEVPWSPVFDYLAEVFAPSVRAMGGEFVLTRRRPGWYPVGQGEMQLAVTPLQGMLRALDWQDRGDLLELATHSLVAQRLPEHIIMRQCAGAMEALGPWNDHNHICRPLHQEAACPGTTCMSWARFTRGAAGFSALGRQGLAAECVGAEAGGGLRAFLDGRATADTHLADQLLPYAALAAGTTTFFTTTATSHLQTNALVIEQMLGVSTHFESTPAGIQVSLTGLGLQPSVR